MAHEPEVHNMRPRIALSWAATALLVALTSGCGDNSPTKPSTSSSDEEQVTTTLSGAAALADDDLEESPIQSPASLLPTGSEPSVVAAAITPYKWWQKITDETRHWSFAFSDTDSTGHPSLCLATLTKHLTGALVIVPASDTLTKIEKPLDKTLTRVVKLQRLSFGRSRAWKVVGVTGAVVTTPSPNNTTHIVSVRFVATGVDTTITDPQQFFTLRNIIRFAPGDSVHLTVTTTRTDDPVFVHLNAVYRWRLRNNLDGTYSTEWRTSALAGWRHMAVQAMTHDSIYDDSAAFDTQSWHLPFRVTQEDVDFYP